MRNEILIFLLLTFLYDHAQRASAVTIDGDLSDWNTATQRTTGEDGSIWYYTWDDSTFYVGLEYGITLNQSSIIIYVQWDPSPGTPTSTPPLNLDEDETGSVPFEATDAIVIDNSYEDSIEHYSSPWGNTPTGNTGFEVSRFGNQWEVSFPREGSRVYLHARILENQEQVASPNSNSYWGYLLSNPTTIPNLEGQIGTWPTATQGNGNWGTPATWEDSPDENSFVYINHDITLDSPSSVGSLYVSASGSIDGSAPLTLTSGGHADTEGTCCDEITLVTEGSATIGSRGSPISFKEVETGPSGTVTFSQTSLTTLTVKGATVSGDVTYSGSTLNYVGVTNYPASDEWSNPKEVNLDATSSVILDNTKATDVLNILAGASLTLTGSEGEDLNVTNLTNNGSVTLSADGATLIVETYTSSSGVIHRNSQTFGCPVIDFTVTHVTCGERGSINTQVTEAFFDPLTFSWSPTGSTEASLSNLEAGVYQLTVNEVGVDGDCPPWTVTVENTCSSMTTSSSEIVSEEDDDSLAIGLGIAIPLILILIIVILAFFFLTRGRRGGGGSQSNAVEEGVRDRPVEMVPVVSEHTERFSSVQGVGISFDQNVAHRRTMEDEHVAIDQFGGVEDQGFFAVYDGHGGREVAEFVVKKFHKNVLAELKKCTEIDSSSKEHPTVISAFQKAYQVTDEQIVENNINKAGATSAACFVRKNDKGERWLYSTNIGDARAVLCRGGVAVRLTRDHKATDEEETKRIKDAGGWVVHGKVAGILAVTRAFGDIELKQWVISEPHVHEVEIKDTDTYLIVACDGLWDVCSDQDAVDILLENKDQSAQKMSDLLLDYALKNKTKDNVSVLVVVL